MSEATTTNGGTISSNLNWILPVRGRNSCSYGFYARVSNHGREKNAKYRPQLVVTLSAKCMNNLRWYAGDRVQIAYDDDTVYVRRVTSSEQGFSLSPVGADKKARQSMIGKPAKCTVKVTMPHPQPDDTLFREYSERDSTIIDGMLALSAQSETAA